MVFILLAATLDVVRRGYFRAAVAVKVEVGSLGAAVAARRPRAATSARRPGAQTIGAATPAPCVGASPVAREVNGSTVRDPDERLETQVHVRMQDAQELSASMPRLQGSQESSDHSGMATGVTTTRRRAPRSASGDEPSGRSQEEQESQLNANMGFLQRFTLKALQDQCREMHLPVTGIKHDVVRRLAIHMTGRSELRPSDDLGRGFRSCGGGRRHECEDVVS